MVLNNALYLNKQIFAFKLTNSPPCSSCKAEHEIRAHVFSLLHFSSIISRTRFNTSRFATTGCHIWLSETTKLSKIRAIASLIVTL